MIILHAYIKKGPNIVTVLPFRYNNGDGRPVESRELIIEAAEEDTRDSLRSKIVKILDEEKQDGINPDDYPSGVPNVVTIE